MLASTPVKLRQHFICIAMCTESDVGLLALCVSLTGSAGQKKAGNWEAA